MPGQPPAPPMQLMCRLSQSITSRASSSNQAQLHSIRQRLLCRSLRELFFRRSCRLSSRDTRHHTYIYKFGPVSPSPQIPIATLPHRARSELSHNRLSIPFCLTAFQTSAAFSVAQRTMANNVKINPKLLRIRNENTQHKSTQSFFVSRSCINKFPHGVPLRFRFPAKFSVLSLNHLKPKKTYSHQIYSRQRWKGYSPTPSTTSPPTTNSKSAKAFAKWKVFSPKYVFLPPHPLPSPNPTSLPPTTDTPSSTPEQSHRLGKALKSLPAISPSGNSSNYRRDSSGMWRCGWSIVWTDCWGRVMMGRTIC